MDAVKHSVIMENMHPKQRKCMTVHPKTKCTPYTEMSQIMLNVTNYAEMVTDMTNVLVLARNYDA